MRPHKDGDEIILNRAVLDSFNQLHEWMDWVIAPQSIEETKAYIEFSQKYWAEKSPEELPLLIFDAKGEDLIGAAGFNAINWKVPAFEIRYESEGLPKIEYRLKNLLPDKLADK